MQGKEGEGWGKREEREREGKMMDQGRNIHNSSLWMRVECHGFESHPRQLIFLRKSDCLGCAVLLCLVFVRPCLLPSLSSLIKTCIALYKHSQLLISQ